MVILAEQPWHRKRFVPFKSQSSMNIYFTLSTVIHHISRNMKATLFNIGAIDSTFMNVSLGIDLATLTLRLYKMVPQYGENFTPSFSRK